MIGQISEHWYWRNQSRIVGQIGPAVGPHADTVRWSTTLVARKRGIIQWWQAKIVRLVVGAATGDCLLVLYVAGSPVAYAHISTVHNFAGAENSVFGHIGVIVNGGDLIEIRTIDTGTGGICSYQASVSIDVFDGL